MHFLQTIIYLSVTVSTTFAFQSHKGGSSHDHKRDVESAVMNKVSRFADLGPQNGHPTHAPGPVHKVHDDMKKKKPCTGGKTGSRIHRGTGVGDLHHHKTSGHEHKPTGHTIKHHHHDHGTGMATNTLGNNPSGTNPLGSNPLGTNPTGSYPMGTCPLGTYYGCFPPGANNTGYSMPGGGAMPTIAPTITGPGIPGDTGVPYQSGKDGSDGLPPDVSMSNDSPPIATTGPGTGGDNTDVGLGSSPTDSGPSNAALSQDGSPVETGDSSLPDSEPSGSLPTGSGAMPTGSGSLSGDNSTVPQSDQNPASDTNPLNSVPSDSSNPGSFGQGNSMGGPADTGLGSMPTDVSGLSGGPTAGCGQPVTVTITTTETVTITGGFGDNGPADTGLSGPGDTGNPSLPFDSGATATPLDTGIPGAPLPTDMPIIPSVFSAPYPAGNNTDGFGSGSGTGTGTIGMATGTGAFLSTGIFPNIDSQTTNCATTMMKMKRKSRGRH